MCDRERAEVRVERPSRVTELSRRIPSERASGEFIGVMEDTGMMTIVGEWVLRTACALLGDDGPTGTFSNEDGPLPW